PVWRIDDLRGAQARHRHLVPETISPERVVGIRGLFTRRSLRGFGAKVELSLLRGILELGPDRFIIFRLVGFVTGPLARREDGAGPDTLQVRPAIRRPWHFANFVFCEACFPVVGLVRRPALAFGGYNRLNGAAQGEARRRVTLRGRLRDRSGSKQAGSGYR